MRCHVLVGSPTNAGIASGRPAIIWGRLGVYRNNTSKARSTPNPPESEGPNGPSGDEEAMATLNFFVDLRTKVSREVGAVAPRRKYRSLRSFCDGHYRLSDRGGIELLGPTRDARNIIGESGASFNTRGDRWFKPTAATCEDEPIVTLLAEFLPCWR
jgi:hypothetical protein